MDYLIGKIGKSYFDYESDDIEDVWDVCISDMRKEHAPIFTIFLPLIDDDKKQKRLKKKLHQLDNK